MSSPEQRRIAELEAENAALRGRLDAASDGDLGPFLDGLAVGVVEADADGRMTRVNRRWCEMLASDEKTLLGRSIAEVTHPDSLPATVAAVERLSGAARTSRSTRTTSAPTGAS